MSDTTIEWTGTPMPDGTILPGYTFNPWIGCAKVSAGCKHCYAENDTFARVRRSRGLELWGADAVRHVTSEENWRKPVRWNREAAAEKVRRRVFCASMADVFEDRPDLEWPRRWLFELIEETPWLDWLLLTKRPENMVQFAQEKWSKRWPTNVWAGCTVENQEMADQRITHLLRVPARVRFLSVEPMLGPVDLARIPWMGIATDVLQGWDGPDAGIHWVIVGGESGPKARPMHPDWARSIRDQCVAARVPFFFKQWGAFADLTNEPDGSDLRRKSTQDDIFLADGESVGAGYRSGRDHGGMVAENWKERGAAWMSRLGKAKAGRLLDGRTWDEFPTVKP
jgi:protein gp37